MIKTIRGIVISETPFSENSKILNIMCEDGIIGVVSKGCKSLKSRLRLISSKFAYADFTIYYNDNKLSTLKEGIILDNFNNIKSDLILLSYLSYIVELSSQVMRENQNPDIFNLAIKTIIKIEYGLNPRVMLNILEIKLLDYLGVGISLNACSKCGSNKNIITINADAGGYLCQNCRTNEIIYDEKVRKMLRMYYLVDIDTIKELQIKDYIIEAINIFLNTYYDRFTGIYIHSKKFLNKTSIIENIKE